MQIITTEFLKRKFTLPGTTARRTLSIDGYSHAGVLVPLVQTNTSLELLFTKRTQTVETHKGQISFPGGMVDSSDNTIVHTALREADEEIGLAQSRIEILGLLDDMATPSGFVITPVVGMIAELPYLQLNPDEVAEVFRVELDFFADPSKGRIEVREFHGRKHEVWFYECGDYLVWGATAMMIRSLLKRLELV